MRTKLSLAILIAASASQMGATDGCDHVIIRDPGFDLWCGDQLCTWKVIRGDVKRVPTWHESDAGIELLGPDAAISQLTSVNNADGTCIKFDLVANVEENAEARLEVDVFGDGSIEMSERMPTSRWKPLTFKIRIKPPFSGVRFQLSKQGAGRAVFAQIDARLTDGCEDLPLIATSMRPLGAPCDEASVCASGLCDFVPAPGSWFGVEQVCVACKTDTCGPGEVCGRGDAISGVLAVPNTCVTTGAHELGEQCAVDDECATALCYKGVCSTCSQTCTTGEACGIAYPYGPSVCSPGLGNRAATEPCATNADCASGHCNGAVRKQCPDGRVCDSPMDCPIEDGLAPGPCYAFGIQGGRCQ